MISSFHTLKRSTKPEWSIIAPETWKELRSNSIKRSEKLLESNLDVQGDDRLSAEFDKLVEDVYAAEAAALERGDTLSPHNYVPSPLESFSGLTFPVDPRIKRQAQQEIKAVRSDLPLVSNDYVDGVLTYFQNRGRGYITTALKRLGIYQPIISEALAEGGDSSGPYLPCRRRERV